MGNSVQPTEHAPAWSPATAVTREEFTVLETLYRDARTTVFRALRRDGGSVILKALDPRRCREKDLERLRREYELEASLDLDSAVRPYGLESYDGMPALVLEDFGGEPLERLAMPMPLERFLDLAVRIAGAVAEIHDGGVVHKDLKPANVVVDPTTFKVKIADFGIATRLPRERHEARPPELVEGSLPYMSPEQTGRMNRVLDSRSDLYSLGVTFYRMLTGRLPFEAQDPLEWIHCHIARIPPSPAQLVPELPEAVARIVVKLLAKMAEDRYQTARGLQRDLEFCLRQLRGSGRIDPFPLGARDVPDRLQIPQRLYGREEQVATLLRAFERVAETGAPELVLVSGYSGIGKSSLVHELEKPIVGRRGLFATSKFDQYRRDVPYSTIAQAFRELVQGILVESGDRLAAWRQRLQAAFGTNGQLVVDVIPEVELLVGKQSPVPELPLTEAKERFHLTFRRFLSAFAREEHPLTLFLDDLQWTDAASLELLADVLAHPDTRHLLVIGAYRENEVTPGHPLMMALDRARRSGLAVQQIVLAPLSHDHLLQFIADAMRRPTPSLPLPSEGGGKGGGEVHPRSDRFGRDAGTRLALLVEEKTAGNPYFAIQFLTSLEEDGILRLDPVDLTWRCDVDSARARGYTDNVVDLMVAKLRRLSPAAQEAVKIAACAGNVTDTATLSALRGQREEETHRDLWELVREGLLLRSSDTYRFSHDRVREAAHALIPEDERPRRHLTLGRLLLAHTPAEQLGERVFDIVNQLNRGARWIEDPAERWRLAELDLLAGRRAKAGAAYGAACEVLAAGMAMLPGDPWLTRHELTHDLHFERAQCEFVHGSFEEAEQCLSEAMLHARSRAEKAAGHRLRIEVYTFRGEHEKAIESLLECAALFGLALERNPPAEMVQERYQELRHALGDRTIEDLLDLRPMSDPDVRALLEVLTAAFSATYILDARLNFAIVSESVRLSIEHGNSPSSAFAYGALGAAAGPYFGAYRDGYRFGKLARDLVERPEFVASKTEAWLAFCACCAFWGEHVSATLPLLEEALRFGTETGRLVHASGCACQIVEFLLARGEALSVVERRSEQMLHFVRKAKHNHAEDNILPLRRLVHRLRGRASSPASAGGRPGEDEGLDGRIQGYAPLDVSAYYIRTLQERFLFGEHREALSAAAPVRRFSEAFWSLFGSCEYSFFLALTLAALHGEAPAGEREEHLRELRGEVERHRTWAEVCPENFANRFALVSAELARVEGRELDAERLYEEAIRSAREDGFVQNEALAYELASRFHRARGLEQIADLYLRDARACYARWGADGKVKQLERLHPQLVERAQPAPAATFVAHSEQLDLLSVVKSSQTISSEMEIEKLVPTLLHVVLEQGGARRGCLVLARDGGLFVEAEASIEERGVMTRILPSLPMESSLLLPVSVVQYARVARQPVIVEDASAKPGKFASEPYFSRHGTRSVLCLPILRQAELVGLLYLENPHVAGAFTPDRLTTLSLLGSQAAISVENARLLLEERKARQRVAFLSEAGTLLSESLDYEETLSRLGRLCVQSPPSPPSPLRGEGSREGGRPVADWCVLDLLEGREIRRLAGACADPAKEPLLELLRQRHPVRWDSPHPAARCLRSGEPLLIFEATDDDVRSHCEDEDHFELIRALGTRSGVIVPLVAHGQTLGVFSMASATPGRYGQADLELARDLGNRAGMAIDNARLYREALGLSEAERRRAEAEAANRALQQQAVALEAAKRAREDVLAIVSHDFRSPLGTILMSAGALEKLNPEGPGAEMARLISRSATRMSRLANDLLDFSAIEAGRLSLARAPVEAASIASEVIESFHPLAESQGAQLVADFAPGAPTIECDRDRIIQVLSNLLANAIHVSPRGGTVTVSVAESGGWALFSVKDQGPGMPPDELPGLFDRYSRGRSAKYKGTGLGLAIARKLVDLHGGRIWAESTPGRGSTFRVQLPAVLMSERRPETLEAAPE